ncbi:MAG: TATA-box-binding protein [Methanoregula sp.]|jgi:transcription initiation factor TFIID TATA-box-binding protein|uniref:TATA-box-binding protein n=1 Tax=Methanoregula sp. TaxID=2052170 RepID=UPI0025CE089E|nr:TATA-box-binding protein [Methanoregula sp.]MCK9632086.1 TATA-box-binding protein [Methanoregula sp.]
MKESGNTSLKIENIVAAGTIADAIDLEFIATSITDCTFTKKKFPGAVYHMQNPKSAALIFASGRIVLTGLHRAEDIETALQNLLKKIREAGITCLDDATCAVTNIVCTYNIGFPLNLVRIVAALMDHERVEYEPEAFPGLVCRISEPRIVFLLFSSGKIVITGGKNMDDVKTGLNVLMEKLSVVDPKITRIKNF